MDHEENPVVNHHEDSQQPMEHPAEAARKAEEDSSGEVSMQRKTRPRRIWKTSDFFLDHGAILEYRGGNHVVCKVVDDHHVIIQMKDGSDVWVKKTFSGAMKIADKRIRGEDVGGKTTPPFQTKWLYEGETLERRRLRILEDMANGED